MENTKTKVFDDELVFENDFVKLLKENGWESETLKYKTEDDLIKNWASILYDNNRSIDKLGSYPLTDGEMNQIIEQITRLRTPFSLNSFINGKTVAITRDNPEDKLHCGKEVSLHIYDRQEIAAGKSRYQIVEQPKFNAKNSILPARRGDVMLLINGMPVFHIELKKSGVPISTACNQIEKYSNEQVFTGIFSLVQIFVAMTPDDAVYFTNPGTDQRNFNKNFFFHWANFDNTPITKWDEFTKRLLNIPMAHQLIGFYTIPDRKDGVLKVLRPYQYYAVSAITTVVAKNKWDQKQQRGGYIFHTTGSGKTLTSFKTADLISKSQDADKVIFLVDRIELDTQSLANYKNFAESEDDVQGVESTDELINKLKSSDPADILIVASIQKMSKINCEDGSHQNDKDIEIINKKRIVFIVDECHRDTFGEMMFNIKNTFSNSLFFGFSGTPIQEENKKKGVTSADVFGSELHRYTIGDGIRDKNVLGFDLYQISTYKDSDIKKQIALNLCKAKSEEDVFTDPIKKEKYYDIMNNIEMAGHEENNVYVKGAEDYLTSAQYRRKEHTNSVVENILSKYQTISHDKKFHSIFATSSIPEALNYYKIFKEKDSNLLTTVLVDKSEDNSDENKYKIEALAEVIEDYNKHYDTHYSISTYDNMKRDISLRMAHEGPFSGISNDKSKQVDLLIVVNQMLTGFDSKWINALYLDKVMEEENIIQAFSRTNRIFDSEKPFGLIFYYRKPYTMKTNIDEAISHYAGENAYIVYIDKLDKNLEKFNRQFQEIKDIFDDEGIKDFSHLPESDDAKVKFAKEFNELNRILEMIKVQGFSWKESEYRFPDNHIIKVELCRNTYIILLQRYKELPKSGRPLNPPTPYDIDNSISEISIGKVDLDYMNSKFTKYLKLKASAENKEGIEKALEDVHSSFALLPIDEQKYANIFIKDVEMGNLIPDENKTFREYVIEYSNKAKDNQISRFATTFGIDEKLLRNLMTGSSTNASCNEYGKFAKLKGTLDVAKAQQYFSRKEGTQVSTFKATIKFDNLARYFIDSGGFDL